MAHEVGPHLARAQVEGGLGFDGEPGLDAEGAQHGLERVGGALVGVRQHAAYGGAAGTAYVDGVEVRACHESEPHDPCAVDDRAQGSGDAMLDLVVRQVGPADREADPLLERPLAATSGGEAEQLPRGRGPTEPLEGLSRRVPPQG
ncbi:hypothetical protein [Nocardioides zhouii]|uniref:Uncharacterized protein n=1 Tax=Nocardioides zhouii TaxID=1168729 RepID=A0A4V1RMX3_9ACTN|nr:hypothetical protein [Nocardioides zhouii]RYC03857.1 hypothetical protein EUA94_21305 [Nocardioides zhouii]